MENQEQLNALESRRLALRARIAESDRAALDYMKSLPGFAEAYPQYAADFADAKAKEEAVTEDVAEVEAEWEFHIGEWVDKDSVVVHKKVRYTVLQGHYLQADWVPGEVPALYKREADPGEEWPEFIHPTGAHDTYNRGDKVTFDGERYISLIDNNSWSPTEYPAGWERQS